MKWAYLLALIALPALGQTPPTCDCTKGCTLVSTAWGPGADQPTACSIYVNGQWVAWSPLVDSSTVSASAPMCPAAPAYIAAVGKVCAARIPPQPPGPITFTIVPDKIALIVVPLTINNAAITAPSTTAITLRVTP